MFGNRDAENSVSPIAEVLTKGFDDGSQNISVKIGTVVASAVGDGVLVSEGVNVEIESSCVEVCEVTELQPESNNAIRRNKF